MKYGNALTLWCSHKDFKELLLNANIPRWCPLHGFLPHYDYSPSSNISRCVDIICRARDLWNVDYCVIDSYFRKNTPYPDVKGSEHQTAIALFERAGEMILHAAIRNTQKDYDETGKPRYDADQVTEDRIMYQVDIRGSRGWKDFNHDIESYKVFAMLAIKEAHSGLYSIFREGKTDHNDIDVIMSVQLAMGLLSRAHDIKAMSDNPDTELGKARRKQQKMFAHEMHAGKNRELTTRNEAIIEAAKNYKSHLCVSDKARILIKNDRHFNLSERQLRRILSGKNNKP